MMATKYAEKGDASPSTGLSSSRSNVASMMAITAAPYRSNRERWRSKSSDVRGIALSPGVRFLFKNALRCTTAGAWPRSKAHYSRRLPVRLFAAGVFVDPRRGLVEEPASAR